MNGDFMFMDGIVFCRQFNYATRPSRRQYHECPAAAPAFGILSCYFTPLKHPSVTY